MDQGEIRRKVYDLLKLWTGLVDRTVEGKARLDGLSSDLESVKQEIEALIEDRRNARRRDKQYYRDLIREAKGRKSDLRADLRSERSLIAELQARCRSTQTECRGLKSQLQAESRKLAAELKRLSGETPEWSVGGLTELSATLNLGHRFCEEQLRSLSVNRPGFPGDQFV